MEERRQGEEEWDLALWLRKAEERCLRAGNLASKLIVERMKVLRANEKFGKCQNPE